MRKYQHAILSLRLMSWKIYEKGAGNACVKAIPWSIMVVGFQKTSFINFFISKLKEQKKKFKKMLTIGFIVLRHVTNSVNAQFWIENYKSIRNHYPENYILIIDDHSDYKFIDTDFPLYKTVIVHSAFPGRGELLPYHYYLNIRLFDIAVILHDSTYINTHIDFHVKTYKLIWTFEHHWDQIDDERAMIDLFHNPELRTFYENKNLWKGCFGGMSVITHDYLRRINEKYEFAKLIPKITSRSNRMSFERVIACLLQKEDAGGVLLGDIHKYMPWSVPFDKRSDYEHLPIVKTWSGR